MKQSDSFRDASTSDPSARSRPIRPKRPTSDGPAAPQPGADTSLLEALTDLREAVTRRLPANQESLENKKHAAAIERLMRRYFGRIETAFPWGNVTALYNRHVKP